MPEAFPQRMRLFEHTLRCLQIMTRTGAGAPEDDVSIGRGGQQLAWWSRRSQPASLTDGERSQDALRPDRLCASFGHVGWTVQHAQNVRFWLVWQVVRSSWPEQYCPLHRGPRLGRRDGPVIDVMRKATLGLIGSHVPSPLRCRSGPLPGT